MFLSLIIDHTEPVPFQKWHNTISRHQLCGYAFVGAERSLSHEFIPLKLPTFLSHKSKNSSWGIFKK
jgi:hypothetical protein